MYFLTLLLVLMQSFFAILPFFFFFPFSFNVDLLSGVFCFVLLFYVWSSGPNTDNEVLFDPQPWTCELFRLVSLSN